MKTTRISKRYELKDEEVAHILNYLEGFMSAHELAKKLNYSTQGVINLVTAICSQWFQEGNLVFKNKGKK